MSNDVQSAADRGSELSDGLGAWQPIATAPRDGTEVWAYNGEQARMRWIEGDGYALWAWADETLCDVDPDPEQPTHYMPLPTPPQSA